MEAQGYDKLVKALRHLSTGRCEDSRKCELCAIYETCLTRCVLDAAAAIEELQQIADHHEQTAKDYWKEACEYKNKWVKSETDATNLTGKLAQAEAEVEWLNREIDKRIATEIELSNQVDALQAEVGRLQDKLCDWCAVCPKERRKPENCELLSETPVMYGPSDAKMEVQDG